MCDMERDKERRLTPYYNDIGYTRFGKLFSDDNQNDEEEIEKILNECEMKKLDEIIFTNCKLEKCPMRLITFDWVKSMNVKNAGLISLENLPPNLEELNASRNKISYINPGELPATLKFVDLSFNNIAVLENLPEGLLGIDVGHNKIVSILNPPKSLQEIGLCNNSLTVIPDFGPNLLKLDIGKNNITDLDNLPQTLLDFDCSLNNITIIREELPQTLEKLVAFYNKITYVMKLPKSLKYIDLSNNELTWLDDYPPFLETLDISNNKLKALRENIPTTLRLLDISGNQIHNQKRFKEYRIDDFKYDSDDDDSGDIYSWRGKQSSFPHNNFHGHWNGLRNNNSNITSLFATATETRYVKSNPNYIPLKNSYIV